MGVRGVSFCVRFWRHKLRQGGSVAFGLANPPDRAYNVPVHSFIKRRQGMIKLEFNEKAYQEYVKKPVSGRRLKTTKHLNLMIFL
jgi:hypothetical protein